MKLRAWAGLILILVVSAMPLMSVWPGLVADTVNGSNWTRAGDLVVTKAECKRYQLLVSHCTVHYTGIARSEIKPELDYLVYGSWANEQVTLLRSTTNPAVVSTNQGIRDLRARQVTAGVWIGIWLVLMGLMALAIIAKLSSRAGRASRFKVEAESTPAAPSFAMSPPAFQPPGAAPVFGRRGR